MFGGGDRRSCTRKEKWKGCEEQGEFQAWCLVPPGACERLMHLSEAVADGRVPRAESYVEAGVGPAQSHGTLSKVQMSFPC